MAVAAGMALTASAAATSTRIVEVSAVQLYEGFQAGRAALVEDGRAVSSDNRRAAMLEFQLPAVLVTDPIEVGPRSGALSLAARMTALEIVAAADVPHGAEMTIEARGGERGFDFQDWSPWQSVAVPRGMLTGRIGRFVQLRVALKSGGKASHPVLRGVTLKAEYVSAGPGDSGLSVDAAAIQRIVRSPIEFQYERRDQPALKRFREAAGLDAVVAGKNSDFEKMVALMDWVGHCRNERDSHREIRNGGYAWDIERVFKMESGQPVISGHCMSYAQVLVSAASALGYKARHMAVLGFREASHEIVDMWVPSLGKWVAFDPSLTSYYFDPKTGEPLNTLELHAIVADTFAPAGRDMNWFVQRSSEEVKATVRRLGGKSAVGCRLGPWSYGAPMSKDYDWGYYHGYLACGFVQMTPRNDFHTHAEANTGKFGEYPGYGGYPLWADSKTPPRPGVTNWYTRTRDFGWTLDQASLRLETDAEEGGRLRVEFGNSMPFFARYNVKVNGEAVPQAANPFTWTLRPGQNRLQVEPVDEFGQSGAGSEITVRYGR